VLTADIRHAVWAAAQDAAEAGDLTIPPSQPTDPSTLRPGGDTVSYISTLPYLLTAPGRPAREIATLLAARLAGLPWIAAATATGGHLTVTVTADALAALAVRIPAAPGCARSDILRGLPVPAAPPAALAAAPDWPSARGRLGADITCRLARTAGANIYIERLRPSLKAVPATLPVKTALGYAGPDVVRYALLAEGPRWQPRAVAELPVRHHLGNPVYAVRYAHAHAASTLRQAADLDFSPGEAAEFAPRLLGHPSERALLGALSWLPERVAWAARSGRPGEFARYLEVLAGTYHDCREQCPALPFGGHSAPRHTDVTRARLWLVTAARTAIAAGLDLLGISAPDRL
jgi:arginyl-tRNA synthetase